MAVQGSQIYLSLLHFALPLFVLHLIFFGCIDIAPDRGNRKTFFLTLVLLNKLRCHAHFYFPANHITWSRVLIWIHVLKGKQCRSRSADLDLHCLQRQDISGFSRTRVNSPRKHMLYPQHMFSWRNKKKINNFWLKKAPSEKTVLHDCVLSWVLTSFCLKENFTSMFQIKRDFSDISVQKKTCDISVQKKLQGYFCSKETSVIFLFKRDFNDISDQKKLQWYFCSKETSVIFLFKRDFSDISDQKRLQWYFCSKETSVIFCSKETSVIFLFKRNFSDISVQKRLQWYFCSKEMSFYFNGSSLFTEL